MATEEGHSSIRAWCGQKNAEDSRAQGCRKIKRPFPPTASAHPLPLCSRWCPRLTSARATGRHPAPQGTDRTDGWGRAAGAAGGD